MDMKKTVFVIGQDHHNTLGIVRSLGNQYFIVLCIHGSKKSYVSKSKFVDECYVLNDLDDRLIFLINKAAEHKKVILLPSSDKAASYIDLNISKYHENVMYPNIKNKEGKITYYMDKKNMTKLFLKYGIQTPLNFVLQKNSSNDDVRYLLNENNFDFPLIVKPVRSIDGDKLDIKVVHNEVEFLNYKNKMFQFYEFIIVEQYVKKDYEIGVLGYSFKDQVVIPRMIQKDREGPINSGSSTYGLIKAVTIDTGKLKKLLKELGYDGIFDAEYIVDVDGNIYLIEINFRNGGNSYAITRDGFNLIEGWVERLDLLIDENKKDSSFMLTHRDLKYHLIPRRISLKSWIRQFVNSHKLILSFSDFKPFFYLLMKKIGGL